MYVKKTPGGGNTWLDPRRMSTSLLSKKGRMLPGWKSSTCQDWKTSENEVQIVRQSQGGLRYYSTNWEGARDVPPAAWCFHGRVIRPFVQKKKVSETHRVTCLAQGHRLVKSEPTKSSVFLFLQLCGSDQVRRFREAPDLTQLTTGRAGRGVQSATSKPRLAAALGRCSLCSIVNRIWASPKHSLEK